MGQMFVAFVSGILFAGGLVVADVTDPSTVLDFLDIFGSWNPQLGVVVGGAVGVAALGQLLVRKRAKPVLAQCFAMPMSKQVDKKLVLGGMLFGVGWGLGGYCPAPALTGVVLMDQRTATFVIAMFCGMLLYHWLHERPRHN